jgi:2'-5' RNA ligase
MRLFIAINFKENEKNQIQDIIKEIKKDSIQGRFIKNEHMHLTLEFLGEMPLEKVKIIKDTIKQVTFESFTINLSKIGYFEKKAGNIYWIGIEDNEILFGTQAKLHKLLTKQGFKLEDRPYKPHITIGRKVKMKENFNPENLFNSINQININVDKIDLMKSEYIDGRLVHQII